MEQQEFNLAKQLKGLWRFKWVILLMMLVAGGTAWGFTSMRPPVYEATATVMVESGEPELALPAGLEITYFQDIGSQIEVMRSRGVLEQAVSQLEPGKAANPQLLQLEVNKLNDALKIQQVRGTSLVALTVVSSDAVLAQKQANAVAEAYVYAANRARLSAIETSLENTKKQLKKLSATQVDLFLSPSLTRLTTQIDTTIIALETASKHLQQIGPHDAVALPEESPTVVEDAGTVLTPSQLNMISESISVATSDAKKISELTQEFNLELNIEPIDLAVIESQTRALATKLGTLSPEIEAMCRAETDPQVNSELLYVEELVQVASATGGATLEQVVALSVALSEEGMSDQRQNLRDRIEQHTVLLLTALEAASEQLQQIEPRAATFTQLQLAQQLAQSQLEMQVETLIERAASAIIALQALSQQLQPLAPEESITITRAELATMEARARMVATTLDFLLSEVEDMRLNELAPQDYAELLSVQEWLAVASNTAGELPNEVTGLSESGGDALSYTALENLRQELQLALLTSDSSATRVVDMAVVSPTTTTIFVRYKNVFLAIVAGLLLGILSALVLQYFDRRVRDASQVASYLGLPMVARVPVTWGRKNRHPPSALKGSSLKYLEAFRMLRTNLGLDSCPGKVLLISSPEEREGKTTVSANLARVVALQGRRVLLIDGNLRKPDIAASFGLLEAEGLPEFLTDGNELSDYITQADGVDILASRAASAASAEMLSSPQMKALLEKARQTYDVVIVDSAPIIGCADTRILAKEADEVLLVLQPDVSKLDLTKESRQTLEAMGVRVSGFMLNKVLPKECESIPLSITKKPQVQG